MTRDEYFMGLALKEARLAYEKNEVPVGAVIVCEDKVIASGYNLRETDNNALCHAEIIAINNACKALSSWRLSDCELYVTMEPCIMCAGAAINAEVKRVIWGAKSEKGCFGTMANFSAYSFDNPPKITGEVLTEDCGKLLKDFFAKLRN